MHFALNNVLLPHQMGAGRAKYRLRAPARSHGLWITPADVHLPYGRACHSSAYLTHILAGVLLVWDRGRLRGSQARWRCGNRTMHFRLLDEPTSPICAVCTLDRGAGRARPT